MDILIVAGVILVVSACCACFEIHEIPGDKDKAGYVSLTKLNSERAELYDTEASGEAYERAKLNAIQNQA